MYEASQHISREAPLLNWNQNL